MNSNCQLVTCASNAPTPDVTSRLCTTNAQCVPDGNNRFECECDLGYSGDAEALCVSDSDCVVNDDGTEIRLTVSP